MKTIDVDYLIVGAGAAGMAFADTMITETEATLAIVDRYHGPGGHWTTAYPFVRLHQPSAFYGVNSRPLGSDTIDRVGWNEGLYELATAGEVCAYFDQVMHQQLLPTGRVSYFPVSEYEDEGRFRTAAGQLYAVNVHRKIVDATYMRAIVPSMRPAPYPVAPGIACVPPNELPAQAIAHDRFVVVGAGKTGMDACLWLLRHGFDPDRITWIMPRDSWLLDRALVQPGPAFVERVAAAIGAQFAAIEAADSAEDLFDRLELAGNLVRLDPAVRPSMYRCATVSQAELVQLRRIPDVVRMGRVLAVEQDSIRLTDGEVPSTPSSLYIDCTADGLEDRPEKPVFDGDAVNVQAVRGCQQVFSAALIAHVEAAYDHDSVRNDLCVPVSHPNAAVDWLRITLQYNRNHLRWLQDDKLMDWLESARLDQLSQLLAPMALDGAAAELRRQTKTLLEANNEKLVQLLATADRREAVGVQRA